MPAKDNVESLLWVVNRLTRYPPRYSSAAVPRMRTFGHLRPFSPPLRWRFERRVTALLLSFSRHPIGPSDSIPCNQPKNPNNRAAQ